MAPISRPVYVDDPARPSGPGRTCQSTISVSNQHNIFFEGEESVEKIVIHNPHVLGMRSNEQKDCEEFIEHVLLTCNLLLKHTRLSIHPSGTDIADLTPAKTKDNNATIEYGPDGPVITGRMRIPVRFTASISIGTMDELDEVAVCGVLAMICTIYNDEKPSQKVANVRSALTRYSEGIRAQDKNMVLKGLYAAADTAVNFDKVGRDEKKGGHLDSAMCLLAEDETIKTDIIRKAVNSLKHAASEKQLQDRPDDMDVYKHIVALRPASSRIIQRRLEELAGNRRKPDM